jgi:heat-inducible transcriptional repressor
MIQELNDRSREIFRQIVETYMESGFPVGSRTLSRRLGQKLSPASIRNVMADLEALGLLYAPHTSAGRLPTEIGLRLFVDGLLEVGNLSEVERTSIEGVCAARGRSVEEALDEATQALSGLSRCAGVVVAAKQDAALKHIEFVHLGGGRGLVVIVTDDGMVENRVLDLPAGLPYSALIDATNYLNARLAGRTLLEAREEILAELASHQAEIDALTAQLVEAGLATLAGNEGDVTLIVRGRSNLLDDGGAVQNLERVRRLFDDLESKRGMARLLELAQEAQGVRVFIGSESQLFGLTGSSVVVAPYTNSREKIVGVIGVIGPTRLNYARIVPMVDYTARLVGRLMK